MNRKVYLATHALFLLFLVSVIFSLRAISSISIAAILLTGIISRLFTKTRSFNSKYRVYFLAGCATLFLLQVIAIFYTKDTSEGWNSVRIKTGLMITPLAVYVSSWLDASMQRKLLYQYCVVLVIASLFCLGIAFSNYMESGKVDEFFYHNLVSPLAQHAIYFSLLVLFGIIFLLEAIKNNQFIYSPYFNFFLVIYLSIVLLLLSSKLVITFYLVYLFFAFLAMLKKGKFPRLVNMGLPGLVIVAFVLLFAIPNPVSQRFYDIAKGNINILKQEKFKPSDYFNGLQFRLLQWKFVPEILSESKRWWIGVGPGDSQSYLDEKYLSKNMYSGDPARGTRGYLIYNTHNQFLETTLQTGIIGLIVLIATCYFMLKMAVQQNTRLTIVTVLVLLTFLSTEAPFETQYGIIIFMFFPMFLTAADYFGKNSEKPSS